MVGTEERFTLSLREAVAIWRREPGAPANSYEWYRGSAKKYGRVSMGCRRQLPRSEPSEHHIDTLKVGNHWMVDAAAFELALEEHRLALAEIKVITQAYKEHRLLIGAGGSLETAWGGYSVRADFHLTWYLGSIQNGGGEGSWFCSHCWTRANTEHAKDECHTCSDWGSCGHDCTLSRVFCPTCETSMPV